MEESEDDDVVEVRRVRPRTERFVAKSAGKKHGGPPAFDLLSALGGDAEDVDCPEIDAFGGHSGSREQAAVQFMRKFGGAEALWKATLAARNEGREITGDGVLLGRQRWRQAHHGIDFRYGYGQDDDADGAAVRPESYLGKAGASKASMESKAPVFRPGRGRGRGGGGLKRGGFSKMKRRGRA